MAFNPQRIWAITYNQMWNLSMKDPLPKNNRMVAYAHYSGTGYVNNSKGSNSNNNNPRQVRRNKSDYC